MLMSTLTDVRNALPTQFAGHSLIWRWPALAQHRLSGQREYVCSTDQYSLETSWSPHRMDALLFPDEEASKLVRAIRNDMGQAIMEDAQEPMHQGMFRDTQRFVRDWKLTQVTRMYAEESLRYAIREMEQAERAIADAIITRAEELSGIQHEEIYLIGHQERVVPYTLRSRSYSGRAAPPKVINKKVNVGITVNVRVASNADNFGRILRAGVGVECRAPGGTRLWGSQFNEDAVLTATEKALIERFNNALQAAAYEHNLTLGEEA